MGTSPICERRFCRRGRNGRGGQREASRAKRGLRERIEQQRPITALHFTVLLFKAGNRLIWLIGIVRRSRSRGSAATRGPRAHRYTHHPVGHPEVSDEVRRAAGSMHDQHSRNCSGELATLLLPDLGSHALVKDWHAYHLVEGVVPPRDAPRFGSAPSKVNVRQYIVAAADASAGAARGAMRATSSRSRRPRAS
jgi:hypothetical protein